MDVREGHSPQRYCNLSLGLQFMEYKKKRSCQNTTSMSTAVTYHYSSEIQVLTN